MEDTYSICVLQITLPKRRDKQHHHYKRANLRAHTESIFGTQAAGPPPVGGGPRPGPGPAPDRPGRPDPGGARVRTRASGPGRRPRPDPGVRTRAVPVSGPGLRLCLDPRPASGRRPGARETPPGSGTLITTTTTSLLDKRDVDGGRFDSTLPGHGIAMQRDFLQGCEHRTVAGEQVGERTFR